MNPIARRLLIGTLALLLFALVLFAGGTWWLLSTESGAGFLLARARALTGAQIEVGQRRGALLGPMEWRDLVYEDSFVRIDLGLLKLDWRPAALWDREVAVGDLLLERLDVKLKPQPPRAPSPSGPAMTRLPVNVDIRHISLRAFRLWTAGAREPIEIPRAEFIGRWSDNDIHLARLDLDYPGVGRIDLQGDATLGEAGVTLSQLKLIAPFPLAAQGFIGYQAASDLELAWQDLRWPLSGEPQVTSAKGEASLKGPWKDLQLKLAAALGAKGNINVQARWTGELDAQAQWTGLGWPLTVEQAPYRSEQGRLRFKGMPERYAFDLDAAVMVQEQAGRVEARGSGGLQSVQLDALRATVGKGVLEAAGPLAWAPQPAGDLRGRIANLDPGLFAPDWPGSINGEFSVKGTLNDKLPALNFSVSLKNSRLRNYPLTVDGEGSYADQRLEIARLDVQSGDSLFEASGRASEPYDLKAQLVSQNLAELWPGANGSARLQASFRGTPAQPQLTAQGELVRASLGDYAVAVLQLDTALDWNGPLKLDLEAKQLSAGTLIDRLALAGSGTLRDHRLTVTAQAAQGTVELVLAGGYEERTKRWNGRLDSGRLVPLELAPWTLQEPAALALAASKVDLEPACWTSDPGRACLEAHYSPQATRAAFRLQELAFAYFQNLLPEEVKIDGSVSGTGVIEIGGGKLREARADLGTTAGALRLRDQQFAFQPATLQVSDGAAQGKVLLRLPLEVGGIEADAQLAPGALFGDRALSGELRVDFPDLGFLRLLTPEISAAAGTLKGRYALAGSAGKPQLQGEARLADGRFTLSRPAIELQNVGATLTGNPGGELKLSAQAESGGGRLEVEGRIEPGPKLQVTLKGADFQAANLPEARVWVSPDVQFEMADQVAQLKGTVTVPRADFVFKQSDSGVGPSGDQVIIDAKGAPQEAGSALKLSSNVKLVLGKEVRLSAMGLTTRLEGAVTAVDEPGRDTIGFGEMRVVEGRYKAYGQDLEIQTGNLLFNGGPITKPGLELRAVRQPRDDVLVGIYVRGTLEKPQLSLYSEPSMTQQQQLSWLLLGRPLEQTGGSEDGDMLANAAVALGLGGSNLLAQSVKGGLGIDEISVGAKPGESSDQAMFTVGKYLSPKLFVSYGLGIFQQGQVFKLLYDLGKGFKLSTESGVATGGDLLYTIERK